MSSNYGMKVSQEGHDVKTALKERLVFSSKFDTLKFFASGSGSQSVPAATAPFGPSGNAIVTINHGLGYKPAFIVFCSSIWRTSADLSPYAYRSVGAISPDGGQYSVDNNNLYIELYNGDPGGARTIFYHYHIYYNELL